MITVSSFFLPWVAARDSGGDLLGAMLGVLFDGQLHEESRFWADHLVLSFRMGGISRSYNLIELDSWITAPLHDYDFMQVWAHTRGTYVP